MYYICNMQMCLYLHLLKTRNFVSSSEISGKLQKYAKLQFSVNSKADVPQAEVFLDWDMGGRPSWNEVS